MLQTLIALLALIAALYGTCSAVIAASPYWYSYFTIGSYLFLGIVNRALHGTSTLPDNDRTSCRHLLKLYLSYFLVGSIIDILYGRFVGGMWVYPHYSLAEEIIHVLVIGYPFAFLSVVETYFLIHFSVIRLSPRSAWQAGEGRFKPLLKFLVVVAVVPLFAPLVLKGFARAELVQKTLFLSMIGTIFLFDALNGLGGKRSLLLQALSGKWAVTLAVLLTNVIAAIVHEVPNAYAQEWIYRDVPFTDFDVWGVNILILTFGWLFLVVIALSIREMVGQGMGSNLLLTHP